MNCGAEWDGVEVAVVDWEIPDTPFWRAESLADALTAAGKRAEILYSRTGIIRDTDTRRFKGLWLAQFDENPELASTRLTYREGGQDKPIGPHGAVAGKQWRNTHSVEGVQIDADTFDLSFWEDDMSDAQIDARIVALVKAGAGFGDGAFIRADGADEVYKIVRGQRRWLLDGPTAQKHGMAADQSNVHVVNPVTLLAIPEGSVIDE